MNRHELAAALDGREYRDEMSRVEELLAKENGLVDLMEFRGAINDEVGVYGGGFAHVTRSGLLFNECDNEKCPHFARLQDAATTIGAQWGGDGYSWTYHTAIPHSTFDILEDGEKYCRGIVFALSNVPE
jgi:hypothetical protein